MLTQLLIRQLIKNPRAVSETKTRTAYGKLASIVGIVCNAVLFAGKLTAGLISGSIAITADAVNNLSDASSNVVSLIGFRLGARRRTRSILTGTRVTNTSPDSPFPS